ncbi:MAG: hypothetical protein ACRDEA_12335 [Microcystaceae cyanobacterium]
MRANVISAPRFQKNQTVEFVGGTGKIKNYYSESDSWIYLIEMAMGPEPDFGRIGYETMIVLPEPDLISLAADNGVIHIIDTVLMPA